MKLTCTCGHANHLHFAGTHRCYGQVLLKASGKKDWTARCRCEAFVAVVPRAPELDRNE